MQPSNLIAVSIAAAVPVANALNHCDPRTRQETPTSIGEYLKVVQDAVDKIVDNKRPEATVSTRNGHVNGNYDVNCQSTETCIPFYGYFSCHDEKSTHLRIGNDFNITLKTDDVRLFEQTKGNVFTNVEPIKELIVSEGLLIRILLEEDKRRVEKEKVSSTSVAKSAATIATAVTTGTAATTGTTTQGAATAAETAAGVDMEKAAAERTVVSWFAARVAIVAVIVT